MKFSTQIIVGIVLLLSFFVREGFSQTFPNNAKDSKETAYIERLVAAVKDKALVLRFEGKLDVGRKMDVIKPNTNGKFHHADNQLVVTLSNEALDEFVLTLGPDPSGKLAVFPNRASFKVDGKGVDLVIPLEIVRYTPVEVIAEMNAHYYANEQMLAVDARNLFSAEGGNPARIDIPTLAVKADTPALTGLKVTETGPNSVGLEWRTNNRTNTEVALQSPGQAPKTIREAYRTGRHKLTVADLLADTEYTAKVFGRDFADRPAPAATVTFRTAKPAASRSQSDLWLRVQGKYVVDSDGKPFALGGYSQVITDFWFDEFSRFGNVALAARYFRSMGLNACRFGLAEDWPGYWAPSPVTEKGGMFQKYGGPTNYVKKFLRPIINQIMDEGLYVIIDWHDTYRMDAQRLDKIAQFWEACAKEFKDEPRVAMYQIFNEPCFVDGQNRIDLAPRVREITKRCIDLIRKHDTRHIILVSDWNCGWGWATETQWRPVNFDPGDPYKQIVYSKHIAREHVTDAFMVGGVDRVADKFNIPFFFDEVEVNELMNWRDHEWFYRFLNANPRKYGFIIWISGQYGPEFPRITSAFAQAYLPAPPFPGWRTNPIVQWYHLSKPKVELTGKRWTYRFALPQQCPAGEYGLVVPNVIAHGAAVRVAVASERNAPRVQGGWIGKGDTSWLGYSLGEEQSAVTGARYLRTITPFVEVIVQIEGKKLDEFKEIQFFRLNPDYEMPTTGITRTELDPAQ